MKIPTYSAFYTDGAQEKIYSGEPRGNLIGALPLGMLPTLPSESKFTTLYREDGGDPFQEVALISQTTRRTARITRDKDDAELKIVITIDWENLTLKVLSNMKALDVPVLIVSDPDPENTDAAEAKLLEQELHEIAREDG